MALALEKIEQALDQIRPMIQSHGGDVELVRFEKDTVYVRFIGACATCPISSYTLKVGIEEQLKSALPEIKQVVAVE